MAARSGGSNAFWWTLIGIFIGAAGALTFVIVTSRHHHRPDDEDTGPDNVAVASHVPQHRILPAAAPAPIPASAAPTIDQQVAEDAAAAGLTSRTRTPQ